MRPKFQSKQSVIINAPIEKVWEFKTDYPVRSSPAIADVDGNSVNGKEAVIGCIVDHIVYVVGMSIAAELPKFLSAYKFFIFHPHPHLYI